MAPGQSWLARPAAVQRIAAPAPLQAKPEPNPSPSPNPSPNPNPNPNRPGGAPPQGADVSGLIQTKDMEGCWCVVCLPLLPFSALYRKTATGPDSYTQAGLCFPFLLPVLEHRKRVHSNFNGFLKVGDPNPNNVNLHSSASCYSNRCFMAMKLC